MVRVVVVSYERDGVVVFHKEAMTESQAKQMLHCMVGMKAKMHPFELTDRQIEDLLTSKSA